MALRHALRRMAVGNWLGAGAVAGGALASAGILSLAFAFLTKSPETNWRGAVGLAGVLFANTFGGSYTNQLGTRAGDPMQHITQFPLLITVVSLVVAAVLHRFVIRRYPTVVPALADTVRAVILLAAGSTVLSTIVGAVAPSVVLGVPTEGSVLGAGLLSDQFDPPATLLLGGTAIHPNIGAVFGFSLVLGLVVLLLTTVLSRSWPDSASQWMHRYAGPPVEALCSLLVVILIAGALAIVLLLAHEHHGVSHQQIIGAIVLLPSTGLIFIGLGSGVQLGFKSGSHAYDELIHLPGAVDVYGHLYWVAPLLALAAAITGAVVVIRRALPGTRPLCCLIHIGLLLVTLSIASEMTALHVRIERTSFRNGLEVAQMTFVFAGICALADLSLLLLTRSIHLGALQQRPDVPSESSSQP